VLLKDPPYGAQVSLHLEKASTGWNAPALAPWLENAIDQASQDFFGKPAMYMGEGGTIPFMGMLGEKFPGAQFMITGVLGPHSNAHGPNEFLHIPMGKRVTACVARVIAEHNAASLRGETTGVAGGQRLAGGQDPPHSATTAAADCASARAREFRFQFLDATILFLQRRLHVGRLEAQRDVLGAIGVPRRNIE
jgi:hypothetical protein